MAEIGEDVLMRSARAVLLGVLLLPGIPAQATLEGAKAAFMRGLAKERAKDYQVAIAYYEDALKEYPSYIYANKQLGNCYYYVGDREKSLENFDAYLSYKP